MGSIGSAYATPEQMKAYLKTSGSQSLPASFEASITVALDAASRQVEQYTGRQFNRQEIATPRRYKFSGRSSSLHVDDFYTDELSSLADGDGASIAASYYSLEPLDGVVDGTPGWPFYRIEFDSDYWYPDSYQRRLPVTLVAKWGWPAVPSTVKQATLIIANQLLRLADAPLGVTGMEGQFGGMIRIRDIPQVATLLNRFISTPVMVG